MKFAAGACSWWSVDEICIPSKYFWPALILELKVCKMYSFCFSFSSSSAYELANGVNSKVHSNNRPQPLCTTSQVRLGLISKLDVYRMNIYTHSSVECRVKMPGQYAHKSHQTLPLAALRCEVLGCIPVRSPEAKTKSILGVASR